MIKYNYEDSVKPQAIKLSKFESIDYSSDNDLIHQNHSPDALNIIRDNNMKIKIRDGLKKDFLEDLLSKTKPENTDSQPIDINNIKEICNFIQHGKNYILGYKKDNGFFDLYQILYRTENQYVSNYISYYHSNIPTGMYNVFMFYTLNPPNPNGPLHAIRYAKDLSGLTNNHFLKDNDVYILGSSTMIKLTYFENLVVGKNTIAFNLNTFKDFTNAEVNNRFHFAERPYNPKIKMSCSIREKFTRLPLAHWTASNSSTIECNGCVPIFESSESKILLYPNILSKRVSFTINQTKNKNFKPPGGFVLFNVPQSFIDKVGYDNLKKAAVNISTYEDGILNDKLSQELVEYMNIKFFWKKSKKRNSDFDIQTSDLYTYDVELPCWHTILPNEPSYMSEDHGILTPSILFDFTAQKFNFCVTVHEKAGSFAKDWFKFDESLTEDTIYVECNMDNNVTAKFGAILDNINDKCMTLHGNSGNLSQLVVSAAPTSIYRNYIFYSQRNALDYFPVTNYRAIGQSDSAITGFNRSEFGLVVHKDFSETSAYVLTFDEEKVSETQTVSAANVKYIFPANACVSKKSCENLNESLYLSNIGIQGIIPSKTMNQNIIQVSRGERINNLLFEEPKISNAIAFVYKTYYMLALDNKIFILDMYSQQRNFKTENLTVENNPEKYQLSAFYWIFPEIKKIKTITQFESGVTLIVEVLKSLDSSETIDRIYQLKDTMNFLHQDQTEVDSSEWYWYTKRFEGNGFEYKKKLIGVTMRYKGFTKDDFKLELVLDKSKKNTIPLVFNEETKAEYSEKEITSTQIFNNLNFIQFKISNPEIKPGVNKMKRFTLIELTFKYKERGRRVINNDKELII